MKWPWNKKTEEPKYQAPMNDPQKPEEPKPDIDDWVKQRGEWRKVERCHCGQPRRIYRMAYNQGYANQTNAWQQLMGLPFGGIGQISGNGISREVHTYDICPICGCSDKWHFSVVRSEWESSVSRGPHAIRNSVEVVWTPESCPVKDENDPGR